MNLKKDWNKIVYAVLAVAGAIFFLFALININDMYIYENAYLTAMGQPTISAPFTIVALYITGLVFFVGLAGLMVCKLFNVKGTKYIILAIGIINTILACVFIFGNIMPTGAPSQTGINAIFKREAYEAAPRVLMVLAFALLPLVKGIKELFDKEAAAK